MLSVCELASWLVNAERQRKVHQIRNLTLIPRPAEAPPAEEPKAEAADKGDKKDLDTRRKEREERRKRRAEREAGGWFLCNLQEGMI